MTLIELIYTDKLIERSKAKMEKIKVSFRIDSVKVRALDRLAEVWDRDRSDLLNEAVAAYLDIQQWQIEHIQASIKQAEAGEFISHEEVRKMAAKWDRCR